MSVALSLPFQQYRPAAGHPDWSRLHGEAQALAADLLPRLERPDRGPAAWRRQAHAQATALQNARRPRALERAGREDLWPLYFIWTLLRRCNFRCTYCDDHQGHRYPDLPTAGTLDTEAGRRLLRVMRTGTPAVYFAGGEPTLRDDLPTLSRTARDLRYHPIVVNTNGSLIHKVLRRPHWSTWLADTDIVVVSLDGLHLGRLESLWGSRRAEEVIRNLLLLRALSEPLRFKLMVNAVIAPDAVDDARAVLDLSHDLGIWFCPVPRNVGARVDPALKDHAGYRALAATILERKRRGQRIAGSLRMNERLLGSAPLRCRNTLKPHIDHDGRLFWPCKASVNVPPIRLDVLRHPDVASLWAEGRRQRDPAGFHGPGPRQCGGDCNWAQNYTTDTYVHGLEHPLALLREVVDFVVRR